MNTMKFPPSQNRRHVINALLLASLIAAGGCAQIPSLGESSSLRPVEQLKSAESFSAPAVAWPGDRWWKAYGDPQLDALIEEALRDSPNLAVAQARLRLAGAMTQMAGAALMPEVSGNAALTEE
jgi:outer membrane protein TolC